jgi:membrane-associated phospholipid phosphatase
VLGICAFLALFFQGYFFVLRHPSQAVTVMPLTPLDHWIGFEPAAFWVYVSLWVYVGIAPALLPSLRALVGYGAWAGALCASGLLLFWWWPTAVPAPDAVLDAALAAHAGLALLRGVDAAGNACPSLHVATAVFTALWLHRQLAEVRAPRATHAANLAWLALIAWSTVAVRQHVVLDVVAGAALGTAFGLLALRFGPAPAMPPRAQRLS